jgi:hypothetical protein
VLSRSAGKPALIGLGAAAILAAGAVPVFAEAPAAPALVGFEANRVANQSAEGTATVQPFTGTGFTGMKVTVAATEPATLDVDCPLQTVEGPANTCDLGPLGEEATAQEVAVQVDVPDDVPENKVITLTVTVSRTADGTTETSADEFEIVFKPLPKEPPDPPTPTPTPTKSSPKPTPTKSSSGGGGSNDDNDGSSGGGGSSNGSSGSGSGSDGSASGGSGGGSSYTPPLPNASLQPPQVSGQPQAGPPLPSVAPGAQPSPENHLRNNKTPVAQDLTFERMASAQLAWLAALLVAFSLLLTQLRLGRKRGGPVRVIAGAGRRVGIHRRPRRGLFSK